MERCDYNSDYKHNVMKKEQFWDLIGLGSMDLNHLRMTNQEPNMKTNQTIRLEFCSNVFISLVGILLSIGTLVPSFVSVAQEAETISIADYQANVIAISCGMLSALLSFCVLAFHLYIVRKRKLMLKKEPGNVLEEFQNTVSDRNKPIPVSRGNMSPPIATRS